ncbi:MAG: HD domain-containing protein [Actinomycetota bacterium]|nr:HD domain-containing protein [Actinomycetota bacterium]
MTAVSRCRENWPPAAVLAAAALLSMAALVDVAGRGVPRPLVALGFAALIAGGELFRISLPGDRRSSPVGVAGALGYALVLQVNGSPTRHGVADVVVVVAMSGLAGSALHAAAGRSPQLLDLARKVLAIAAAAAVFRPLQETLLRQRGHGAGTVLVLAASGAVAAAAVVEVGIAGLLRARRDGAPLLATLRNELVGIAPLGMSMAATGMLIALAAPLMGLWALPVFCVPLLVTQFSFRRYAAVRSTYRQTIRSLSRVPELGGYVAPGHSRRVSTLAVAVGKEFGLTEQDLLDLEYAALMHDIGQLSLADPVPGGSTLAVPSAERARIAELGAGIVRTTGTLPAVAEILQRQADPYRRNLEPPDATLPLACRVIKAASAYDDVASGTVGGGPAIAMERLRRGMAYEYDPQVVEALARVLDRS